MKKKYRLKKSVKEALIIISTILAIVIINIICANILSAEFKDHVERVTKKCAEEGYGVTVNYTRDGEQYYVCDK